MDVKSYLSPKTKVKKSSIGGRGLFAIKSIKKNELICLKSGHIINWATYWKYQNVIGDSYFQIDDNFMVAPLTKSELKKSMMYLNHSCEANVGVCGEIRFVALKNIQIGEELTIDYAMAEANNTFRLDCNCGKKTCRKLITGKDWQNKSLQQKYKGYFSRFIQDKIEKPTG